MLKSRLKEIMLDQRESFFEKKELMQRDIGLKKYINTQQIVVITGIRRCGKSSLMYIIKDEILKKTDKNNILYLNFDDERFIDLSADDFNNIFSIFLEEFNPEQNKIVFFFDEIQNAFGWEKFLNRMYEKGIKIFVTGSNATLLSSEIATSLTGRNVVLELFPFSFKEYLKLNNETFEISKLTTIKKTKIKRRFNEYIALGGFPQVLKEKNKELLKDYYNDIFYRDIIARHSITKVNEMKKISNFLASNISKIHSYNTLKDISGIKSISSIKNYLDYFENSFMFFGLSRYSYSLKKQMLGSKKIYCIDTGLATAVGFSFSKNSGRLLENMVFIELCRRGKETYYHLEKNECDFVIKDKNTIISAIQVTKELEHKNEKREFQGLLNAMDAYGLDSGLILTGDQEDIIRINGKTIELKPIWLWALE
ncbi:MAG: ATP-binding protein [Candidatus Diapherotrites archaeon]|nr:ATP-binding protein [Candidatus Diapherotrites archaeon]